jgi:hypothetical protein
MLERSRAIPAKLASKIIENCRAASVLPMISFIVTAL